MALYSEYVPSHPDSPWVMAVPYNPSFFQTYMYLFLCYRHQIRSQVERMGLQSLQTRMQHVQTQRTEKRMYNRTKRARQRGQSTPVMDRYACVSMCVTLYIVFLSSTKHQENSHDDFL